MPRRLRTALRSGLELGLLAGAWVLATELAYTRAVLPYPVPVTAKLLALYATCFASLGGGVAAVTALLSRAESGLRAANLGVALAVLMLGLRLADLHDDAPVPAIAIPLVALSVAVASAVAWLGSRVPGHAQGTASRAVLAASVASLAVACKLLTDSSPVELDHPVATALGLAALAPLLVAPPVFHFARAYPRAVALATTCAPLLAIGALAWDPAPASPAHSAARPAVAPRLPPIFWITIDTLRADRMQLYGHRVPNTPNLDAFARTATVYRRAMSQGPSTAQAVPSLLSGLTPYRHGGVSESRRLPDEVQLLPEMLQEHGYRTIAQSSNHWVSPRYGLGQGFEEFRHYNTDNELFLYDLNKLAIRVAPWTVMRLREHLPDYAYAPIDRMVDAAIAILEQHDRNRPLFFYFHSVDPHGPYQPPLRYLPVDAPRPSKRNFVGYWQLLEGAVVSPEQREAVLARYDGEIAFTDAELGRLFEALRELELFEPALIVITSDHGEHFLEHGLWGHGRSLYAQLLHVPLLIKYPFQREGRGVDTRVATVDIVPSVLELIGERCGDCDGRPLQAADSSADPRPLFAYLMDADEVRPVLRSVVEGGWKLVRKSLDGEESEELFDLERDPGEFHDVRAQHAEIAERLAGRLRDYETASGRAFPAERIRLEPAEIERLRGLGYLQ